MYKTGLKLECSASKWVQGAWRGTFQPRPSAGRAGTRKDHPLPIVSPSFELSWLSCVLFKPLFCVSAPRPPSCFCKVGGFFLSNKCLRLILGMFSNIITHWLGETEWEVIGQEEGNSQILNKAENTIWKSANSDWTKRDAQKSPHDR